MSLFSLFFGKRNTEELEQMHREFISQMQALRQDMQTVHRSIIEEIRQLSSSINASHAKQVEQGQVLAEGVRQSSKSVEALHECIDRLNTPVSRIRPLSDAMVRLQESVGTLSSQISQLLSPPLPVYDGKLDASHAKFVQKTQFATDAITQQKSAYKEMQQNFQEAQKQSNEKQRDFYDVAKDVPSPFDQQTDEIQTLEQEEDDDPPEAR